MEHGIESFFNEERRNRIRIAMLSAVLGAFGIVLLAASLLPPIRRQVRERQEFRTGFAGPARQVDLVRVSSGPGGRAALQDVGTIVTRAASRREGAQPMPPSGDAGPRTGQRTSNLAAPTVNAGEVRMRAEVRRPGGAVFQSEDLVLEHMVLPDYPEEVWGRGIAGRVTVFAFIDSLGGVHDVEVSGGLHPLVDEAVRVAVRQYRFRPYQEDGRPVPLYARLTFRFTL